MSSPSFWQKTKNAKMASPMNQMMSDDHVQVTQNVEEDDMMKFAKLEGAGGNIELGPITILMPTNKDTWPILGKTEDGFCRYHCLCLQSGYSGDVLTNPQCQYCCLHCNLMPFKFNLVTALPLLEDLNFCQVKIVCCDYGWYKFRLGCRYCCVDIDLGGKKTTPS